MKQNEIAKRIEEKLSNSTENMVPIDMTERYNDPIIATPEDKKVIVSDDVGEETNIDFQYARDTLYHSIEKGKDAIDDLIEIASSEESPRAYEVVATLIKTNTDAVEKLLNVRTLKETMEQKRMDATNPGNGTTNNNLFVGSTKELLEMLNKTE